MLVVDSLNGSAAVVAGCEASTEGRLKDGAVVVEERLKTAVVVTVGIPD